MLANYAWSRAHRPCAALSGPIPTECPMVRQEHVKQQSCGRLILVAAVAGALGAWTLGFKPQVTTAVASGPAPGAAGKAREAWPWQGVNSCAATACHGDSGPKGSKRSEYTTWFTYDKHER